MTTERLYKKAERADEVCDVDLTDVSRAGLMKLLYEGWIRSTADMRVKAFSDYRSKFSLMNIESIYDKLESGLYKEAARIIVPFRKAFKGVVSTKDFPFMGFHEEFYAAGYFLSGLMKNTDAELLLITGVPKLHKVVVREKIVVVDEGTELDALVSNNITLHYGRVGTFGNVDDPNNMIINYNSKPLDTNYWSRNGVFVSKTGFQDRVQRSYCIGPEEMADDKILPALLDEMKKAGKLTDVPAIRGLARKIDAHVRKTYEKPREWENDN